MNNSQITDHLRKWVAKCILDGFTNEAIAKKLAQYIPEPERALNEVELIQSDPIILGVKELENSHRKLSNLVDVLAKQLRHSIIADGIPIEDRLSPERFYKEYYFCNRPVVIRGLMNNWPAKHIWSPELFAQRYGHLMIEVSADRNNDPNYEDRFHYHRREILMSEFINKIVSGAENDIYLVAKNYLLANHNFSDLLDEFDFPKGFINAKQNKNLSRLWIGGANTITPLHHDSSNVFFGQVYGRKQFKLIPPLEIQNLYNDRTCFSKVDIDNIDYNLFPLMENILLLDVIVYPGDFLLIPVGWWHAVRSLDISISLSFQNFNVDSGNTIWRHFFK